MNSSSSPAAKLHEEEHVIAKIWNDFRVKEGYNEKLRIIKDLFRYLLTTTEILKSKSYQDTILNKINSIWKSPGVRDDKEFIELYDKLSVKLEYVYGADVKTQPYYAELINLFEKNSENFIALVRTGDLKAIQDAYMKGSLYINYEREKDNRTALHYAYVNNYLDIVKFLIAHGADITVRDINGETPVGYMLNNGGPYSVPLLEYTIGLPNLPKKDSYKIGKILNELLPTNEYKRLGMGSYGLVVTPSFKTKNNTKVTKFMFNKKSYKNALNTSKRIKRNLPSLNMYFEPYPNAHTLSNVEKNNAQLGKILKALQPGMRNTNEIYPIMMENLGISFADLNSTHVPALTRLSIRTILEQYQKLAAAVLELKQKGYIHGDIRETNMMIDLTSGIIKIIDFDWLMKVNEFKESYEAQFYSHPPELIFAKDVAPYFNDLVSNPKLPIIEYKENINERTDEMEYIFDYDSVHTFPQIRSGIIETMYNAVEIGPLNPVRDMLGDYGLHFEIIMDKAYLQIDSYGLGYSLSVLHKLLEKTKGGRPGSDYPIINKLGTWTHLLCDPSQYKRMDIKTFKALIDTELSSLTTSASASASTGKPSSYGGRRRTARIPVKKGRKSYSAKTRRQK